MINQIKYCIVLFFIAISVFSCDNDKEQTAIQRKDSLKIQDSLNKLEISTTIKSLSIRYNALTDWDTLYQYSLLFEDKLKNESRPILIDNARIKDIVRINDDIYCYLYNWNFDFKLKITEEHFQRLISIKNRDYVSCVIKIHNVRKNIYHVYVEDEDSEDRQVMIKMNFLNDYMLYGEMIDFEFL